MIESVPGLTERFAGEMKVKSGGLLTEKAVERFDPEG